MEPPPLLQSSFDKEPGLPEAGEAAPEPLVRDEPESILAGAAEVDWCPAPKDSHPAAVAVLIGPSKIVRCLGPRRSIWGFPD